MSLHVLPPLHFKFHFIVFLARFSWDFTSRFTSSFLTPQDHPGNSVEGKNLLLGPLTVNNLLNKLFPHGWCHPYPGCMNGQVHPVGGELDTQGNLRNLADAICGMVRVCAVFHPRLLETIYLLPLIVLILVLSI